MEAIKHNFFLSRTPRKLVIVFFTAFILGCSGGEDSSAKNFDYSNLPPDPGEAGKLTIEGIDSDADGVRDDVQRYIAKTYADKPEVKELMKKYARNNQLMLTYSNDKQKTLELIVKYSALLACIWKEFPEREEREEVLRGIKLSLLNTNERLIAYFASNDQTKGEPFSIVTQCR